jgi:hypothetical protein
MAMIFFGTIRCWPGTDVLAMNKTGWHSRTVIMRVLVFPIYFLKSMNDI